MATPCIPVGVATKNTSSLPNITGMFYIRTGMITTPDGQEHSPGEFEKKGGKATARKWKVSIRLLEPGANGTSLLSHVTLGEWLEKHGLEVRTHQIVSGAVAAHALPSPSCPPSTASMQSHHLQLASLSPEQLVPQLQLMWTLHPQLLQQQQQQQQQQQPPVAASLGSPAPAQPSSEQDAQPGATGSRSATGPAASQVAPHKQVAAILCYLEGNAWPAEPETAQLLLAITQLRVCKRSVDLRLLYVKVREAGGFEAVQRADAWPAVAAQCCEPPPLQPQGGSPDGSGSCDANSSAGQEHGTGHMHNAGHTEGVKKPKCVPAPTSCDGGGAPCQPWPPSGTQASHVPSGHHSGSSSGSEGARASLLAAGVRSAYTHFLLRVERWEQSLVRCGGSGIAVAPCAHSAAVTPQDEGAATTADSCSAAAPAAPSLPAQLSWPVPPLPPIRTSPSDANEAPANDTSMCTASGSHPATAPAAASPAPCLYDTKRRSGSNSSNGEGGSAPATQRALAASSRQTRGITRRSNSMTQLPHSPKRGSPIPADGCSGKSKLRRTSTMAMRGVVVDGAAGGMRGCEGSEGSPEAEEPAGASKQPLLHASMLEAARCTQPLSCSSVFTAQHQQQQWQPTHAPGEALLATTPFVETAASSGGRAAGQHTTAVYQARAHPPMSSASPAPHATSRLGSGGHASSTCTLAPDVPGAAMPNIRGSAAALLNAYSVVPGAAGVGPSAGGGADSSSTSFEGSSVHTSNSSNLNTVGSGSDGVGSLGGMMQGARGFLGGRARKRSVDALSIGDGQGVAQRSTAQRTRGHHKLLHWSSLPGRRVGGGCDELVDDLCRQHVPAQEPGVWPDQAASCFMDHPPPGSPFGHPTPAWGPLASALQPQPSAPAILQASALETPTRHAHAPHRTNLNMQAPMYEAQKLHAPALHQPYQQPQPQELQWQAQQAQQQLGLGVLQPDMGAMDVLHHSCHDPHLGGLLDGDVEDIAWSRELLADDFLNLDRP